MSSRALASLLGIFASSTTACSGEHLLGADSQHADASMDAARDDGAWPTPDAQLDATADTTAREWDTHPCHFDAAIEIASASDLNSIRRCTSIDRDISIQDFEPTSVRLDTLVEVSGVLSLRCEGTTYSFANLERIDGLTIVNADDFVAPNLKRINGDLYTSGLGALPPQRTDIALPKLVYAEAMNVRSGNFLSFSAPLLGHTRSVSIMMNPFVESMDFGALRSLQGDLIVDANFSLSDLSLAPDIHIEGDMRITDTSGLSCDTLLLESATVDGEIVCNE